MNTKESTRLMEGKTIDGDKTIMKKSLLLF